MNNFTVTKVNMATISIFTDILKEAAEWLVSQGKKNWNPSQFTVAQVLNDCDLDELYIGYKGEEAAGCFRMQTVDEMFWPDAPLGEALYIHKLAVRRKFAGMGISGLMIDWVKEQAVIKGVKYVRLDCIADRTKLCGLYVGQGFLKVDERLVFGKYPTAFFEYRVDE